MKCDKLFKEAFEGIEFRYKLDDTLENLDTQKLTAIGLSGLASDLEASPQMQDNPDIYKLAKRIDAKINYNEKDEDILEYFSDIESGGNYLAKNKSSSAFGKYQLLRGTMVEKAKELNMSIAEAKKPAGQEKIMNSLLNDYKGRLNKFDLPVTKENLFVLHNLGQTGGIRVLRGTYTDSDIGAMRVNLHSEDRKGTKEQIVQKYAEKYNINIPNKQEG